MPEILRNTLRVVEKLGEGGFGMVSLKKERLSVCNSISIGIREYKKIYFHFFLYFHVIVLLI